MDPSLTGCRTEGPTSRRYGCQALQITGPIDTAPPERVSENHLVQNALPQRFSFLYHGQGLTSKPSTPNASRARQFQPLTPRTGGSRWTTAVSIACRRPWGLRSSSLFREHSLVRLKSWAWQQAYGEAVPWVESVGHMEIVIYLQSIRNGLPGSVAATAAMFLMLR